MFWKQRRALISLVALLALLTFVSGCGSMGSQFGNKTPPGKLPESVQITLGGPGITQIPPPQLTLAKVTQVQQLYQTMLALPTMGQNVGCPADAGPTYQLIFLAGPQTLAQAVANSGGCGTVTLSGEKTDRLASQAFWTQLRQAIAAAGHISQPQALAIQHSFPGVQLAFTAHITDGATAQRLYNAILALPISSSSSCSDAQYPTYQMVFQTADHVISASINQQCQTLSLNGNDLSPTGIYSLNASFQDLFTRTLAGARFAQAQPDQLVEEVRNGDTISHRQITDLAMARQFYSTILTLQQGTVGPDCPSASDKINHTATLYTLNFSQWSLPIMQLSVYKGSCQLITPSPGLDISQTLQGTPSFWNQLEQLH